MGVSVRMNTRKAAIVCIQETHKAEDGEMEIGGLQIYFSKAEIYNQTNKGIGGAAIMIRKNLVIAITNIERNSRSNANIVIETSKK